MNCAVYFFIICNIYVGKPCAGIRTAVKTFHGLIAYHDRIARTEKPDVIAVQTADSKVNRLFSVAVKGYRIAYGIAKLIGKVLS